MGSTLDTSNFLVVITSSWYKIAGTSKYLLLSKWCPTRRLAVVDPGHSGAVYGERDLIVLLYSICLSCGEIKIERRRSVRAAIL